MTRRPFGSRRGRADAAPLLAAAEVTALLRAAPLRPGAAGRGPRHGRAGEQVAGGAGSGLDFAGLRPYVAGDDPRHVDWRASARGATTLVRHYHAEVSRPLCLVVDRRPAMAFGTRRRLKAAQAARAALWLAGRGAREGRELAAVTLHHPCQWLPPAAGPATVARLAEILSAPLPAAREEDAGPAWSRVLAGLRARLPTGAGVVLLSDFAGLDEAQRPALAALARHCTVAAVQVVDAAERALPAAGLLSLQWAGRRLTVDSGEAALRRRLAVAFEQRTAALETLFGRAGIPYRKLDGRVEDLAPVLAGVTV